MTPSTGEFADLLARAFAVASGRHLEAAEAIDDAPAEEEIEETLYALVDALRHADLAEADPVGSLFDVTPEEAQRGAKSYPLASAQHEALWALTMLAQVARQPGRARHYLGQAQQCAQEAMAAPVADVVGSGIKAVQEVEHEGVIGLLTTGYASRYGEVDLDGETKAPGAFAGVHEEWAAEERPPILWEHGLDETRRHRPIGYATAVTADDVGLHVKAFIPRDADPRRFSRAARQRHGAIYDLIRTRQATGYSVQGTRYQEGTTNRWWSTGEVSITTAPCLLGARFTLRPRL